MSTYHPDRWTIIELSDGVTSVRKIFSGSYGGYGGSDTWKLSSVIETITEDDQGYEIHCASGSVYMLHKQAYGMSGYMASIFSNWQRDASPSNFTIKVVEGYDYRN